MTLIWKRNALNDTLSIDVFYGIRMLNKGIFLSNVNKPKANIWKFKLKRWKWNFFSNVFMYILNNVKKLKNVKINNEK